MKIDPNIASMVAEKPAQQVNAHDFKQFAALRRNAGANDPATLREVARQFESIFTKMMLDSMRSASFGDPMFGSDQADMYQDMMDDQLAVQLTSGRGIGLADMLIRQLSQGGQSAQAAAPPTDAATASNAGRGVDDAQRRRFIDEMLPHAESAARELGVDPRHVIAQAALETGWGTSKPADASGTSHNFFGIKTGAGWRGASVSADTTEYRDGIAGTERAEFRAYGSVAENVSDYVRLLRENPRYAAALHTGSDVRAFASALQRSGYATDPAYADKIVAVAGQIADLTAARADSVNSFKSSGNSPLTEPVSSRMNSNG
jgi:flagellar protein FlgJ